MSKSKIPWCDTTWNPIIGCTKVSEGCQNCYAEKMAKRLTAIEANRHTYNYGFVINELGRWNGQTNFVRSALIKPLHWKKPRKIFVCSMGDLFHETVLFEDIDRLFRTIIAHPDCDQHIFQILTKRAERMKQYFDYFYNESPYAEEIPLPNLWLGVTTENQKQFNKRVPFLLQIPAAIRFVSGEPLLGPIDMTPAFNDGSMCLEDPVNTLDWVIIGGESGPKARPMHPDWARAIRDQCQEANVPFFFKQWGEWFTAWINMTTNKPVFKMFESFLRWTQKDWVHKGDSCISLDGKVCKCGGDMKDATYPVAIMQKVGKKKVGSFIDGKEYKQFPIIK